MDTNKWRVGVIGLGNMGSGIAEAFLTAGYKTFVYDLNNLAVENLVAKGAAGYKNVKELTNESNIIFTSLPNSNAVKNVYLGEDGLVKSVKPGTILVELSTIEPDTVKEVEIKLKENDAHLLDIPVSGSPDEARRGELKLIAAGDELLLQAINPVLHSFGEVINYVGPVGNAKIIKLVNNLMTMGNMVVAAEAFSIGVKAGVDPNLLFGVLNKSGGRSHQFSKRFPNALENNFKPGFTVDMGEKDVGLAIELSRELEIPTPVAGLVRQIYQILLSEGSDREDIVSILKLYEKWGGIVSPITK
jgi:3-hydroxyisobutyrate dehydrogenase-like beta-hydroxyacid dehydrogenase